MPDHAVEQGDGQARRLTVGQPTEEPATGRLHERHTVTVTRVPHRHHVRLAGGVGHRHVSDEPLLRGLADGQATCLTVTLLDGMVLARSTFESSMHYRGVMVLGTCHVLEGAEKDHALEVITEHLLPGRWSEARHPNKKELAATLVLALDLTEMSVKVADGPPEDEDDDVPRPIWAGVVPLREAFGEPIDAPDLVEPYPVPGYVKQWRRPEPS